MHFLNSLNSSTLQVMLKLLASCGPSQSPVTCKDFRGHRRCVHKSGMPAINFPNVLWCQNAFYSTNCFAVVQHYFYLALFLFSTTFIRHYFYCYYYCLQCFKFKLFSQSFCFSYLNISKNMICTQFNKIKLTINEWLFG